MPLWDPRGTAPFEILSGDVAVLPEHPQRGASASPDTSTRLHADLQPCEELLYPICGSIHWSGWTRRSHSQHTEEDPEVTVGDATGLEVEQKPELRGPTLE